MQFMYINVNFNDGLSQNPTKSYKYHPLEPSSDTPESVKPYSLGGANWCEISNCLKCPY